MRKGEEVACMAPTVPNPDSTWEPGSLPGHGPLGRFKRLRRLRREEGGGIRARSYPPPPSMLSLSRLTSPHRHTEAQSHKHSLTHTEGPVGTIRQPHGHLLSPCHPGTGLPNTPESHSMCAYTHTEPEDCSQGGLLPVNVIRHGKGGKCPQMSLLPLSRTGSCLSDLLGPALREGHLHPW